MVVGGVRACVVHTAYVVGGVRACVESLCCAHCICGGGWGQSLCCAHCICGGGWGQNLCCAHCRSITLVGEKERKFLKDVVKSAKCPVKSRVISPGVYKTPAANGYLL